METSAGPVPDDAAHLLVVDDDRRIRDLLSRYLQREGYRVTTAQNAADARAKLDGLAFDLLILDVMMPGESGFELAKALRRTSQVPILMLTARADAGRIGPLRPIPVSHRPRRTAPRRGTDPSHRSREGHAAAARGAAGPDR